MRKTASNYLAIVLLAALSLPAQAQSEAPKGWQTWTWEGSCFAVLFPQEGGIEELNKQKAYASIKHVPSEGTRNAVAFVSGLEEYVGLSGMADVDGKQFPLLVFQGTGFVKSGEREDELIAALTAGQDLRITWSGANGMLTQTYQLAGLANAKRTIDTACLPQQ